MNTRVSKPQEDLRTPTTFTAAASTSSPLHSSQMLSDSASDAGFVSAAPASSHTCSKSRRISRPCVSSNVESGIKFMAALLASRASNSEPHPFKSQPFVHDVEEGVGTLHVIHCRL